MSIVDVDVLLQDLSSDAPSGPNLEYDPAFLELEQNAVGKPEVQYGTTITPAVPPDWKVVKKQAIELFGRTHDLRVAMLLLRSLLGLHAMPGFADGARILAAMVETRWGSLHPELDPDDDNDPTLRINSLAQLNDAATMLRDLRDTAFVMLPNLGPLSLRVLEQSTGESPVPAGQKALAPDSIQAALRDVSPEAMTTAFSAVSGAAGSIEQIEKGLEGHVGAANALNLAPIRRLLKRMNDTLAPYVPEEEAAPEEMPMEDAIVDAGTAAAPQRAAPAPAFELNSAADVVRMIDRILAYYKRVEPSSPVPLLLERAKRLAPMSFLEVMQNLAPESLQQLNAIRGPQPDQ